MILDAYDKVPVWKFLLKRSDKKPLGRKMTFAERYQMHMNSRRWFRFRDSILRQRGERCEQCRSEQKPLHLHHLTYHRLGREKPKDVKILCVACHEKVHCLAIG